MFHPLTLFLALRYVRTKRRNRFASFVSFVSIAGIGLGVAALIIVLSVMNGFEREVIRHVLGMSSHAVVLQQDGAMENWSEIAKRMARDPRVRATAPYVRSGGMLSRKGKVTGVVVEGIAPAREAEVTALRHYLSSVDIDALKPGHANVLLGDGLARKLDAGIGDAVSLVVPEWDASGQALAPRYLRLTVAGTFHSGMQQYDARLVLIHIEDAQVIFRMGDRISGIRTRFADARSAPVAAREIAQSLGAEFIAIDWTQYHQNFFLALKSQKRIMFVILVLIIAVAAFNIAANMVMVVTEKTRDIAVLCTLGTTRRQIVQLFLLQGLLIGMLGSLLGVLLGAWGAAESETMARLLEKALGVDLINADVYFIDYLPADLHLADLLGVVAAALALAVLATIYPALRAAGIQPAQAIHYE